jgi:hypothetical protein
MCTPTLAAPVFAVGFDHAAMPAWPPRPKPAFPARPPGLARCTSTPFEDSDIARLALRLPVPAVAS